MKIIELDETESTNLYCKSLSEDCIVVARRQSGGRGTKGRSFISDEGGLYLSRLKTYKNFPLENAFSIMVDACVAVCRTVESFGLRPVIRWPNDVLVNAKKISGTLIENTFLGNDVCRSVLGIGINVNNSLPAELENIATTIRVETGKKTDVSAVRDALIKNLEKSYSIDDYRAYINWLGERVTLVCGGETFEAVAQQISDDGRLVAVREGRQVYYSSGELSLRLI